MRILGVSSDFHDSSAALVEDGMPRFSSAEERYSYRKHDSSFPGLAIDSCLAFAGLSPRDLDWVAYHEDPVMKFSRVLTSRARSFPRGFLDFARTMREMALGQLWVKFDIVKKLGVMPGRVQYVPHHLSHAAYAFCTSPYSRAAVLVVDAVGEWSSTTLLRARRDGGSLEIQAVDVIPYPHSLGMVYSAFTSFLGFRVNDGECSVMALASFGKPAHADKVRRIVKAQADGTYEVDPVYFDFTNPERLPLSESFLKLFGKPRSFRAPLPFAAVGGGAEPSADDTYYADVAASVQLVLEETVLALCAKLRRDTGEENLCLAGGVALNSTLNGRLLRESAFRWVHVPPDPGDGGGALGAALYLHSLPAAGGIAGGEDFTPYLGRSYDEESALGLVPGLSTRELNAHRALPTSLGPVAGFSIDRLPEYGRLADAAVADLAAGKVVGWFQGRFENGPRALGNRSILCDPRSAAAAGKLSRHVKRRAAFRPYACSLRGESAGRVFDAPSAQLSSLRWMSCTLPVREDARQLLPQALHADGTTRPQLLSQPENPRFHDLLGRWEAASGSPALLNTSFNESGYPMVSSPVDALLLFLRTDMETLVLNNAILRKRMVP